MTSRTSDTPPHDSPVHARDIEALAREAHVPPSIRGLLASRVDRLSDQDKDILQAAVVMGTSVSLELLSALVHLEEPLLQDILERLCRDGFLAHGDEAGRHFTIRHGLTREAVYESIPLRDRAAMHLRLLELILARDGDQVEVLADHAIHANDWTRAADYCRRSGNKAFLRDAKVRANRLRNGRRKLQIRVWVSLNA